MLEKAKENKTMIIVALALSALALLADNGIYPAADVLYQTYENENIIAVNYAITGGSLSVLVGSILSGFVARKVNNKTILTVSYVVFILSEVLAVAVNNLWYLLVMRTLAGLSMGFITISSAALIADLFPSDKAQSRVMSYYSAMMSLFGALASVAAGYLVLIDWHLIFQIYWVAVPVLVLIIVFVPNNNKPVIALQKGEEEPHAGSTDGKAHWSSAVSTYIAVFIYNALYGVTLTMMAVFLAEEGIGDASTAGLLGMVGTLASMVMCFVFSPIFMKTKKFSPVIFACTLLVGFAFFAVAAESQNIPLLFAGAIIQGFGMGYQFNYYLITASLCLPEDKVSMSIGFENAAIFAGLFLAPYVCPLYESIFGLNSMAECMPFLAGTMFVFGAISFCLYLRSKKVGDLFREQ